MTVINPVLYAIRRLTYLFSFLLCELVQWTGRGGHTLSYSDDRLRCKFCSWAPKWSVR